jgi:hypothetical protein
MNYEDALNTCPQARRPAVEKHLVRLIDSAQECAIPLDTFSSDFIALIVRAFAVSDYLAESLIKQPELVEIQFADA